MDAKTLDDLRVHSITMTRTGRGALAWTAHVRGLGCVGYARAADPVAALAQAIDRMAGCTAAGVRE